MADYVPSVSPDRRRRWFKYLLKHSRMKKFGNSYKKRSGFVEKLDKLRNIEKVSDIHKLDKMSPIQIEKDRHKKIEKKIDRILDYQFQIDNETRMNRYMLSKISSDEERKKKEIEELRKRLDEAHKLLKNNKSLNKRKKK